MIWDSTLVEWEQLLSAGSTIEIVHGLSIPDGTAMPAYDRAAGIGTYGGIFFVQASDAPTLVRDCYAVLNGLEEALSRGWAGTGQRGQAATR